MAEAKISYQGDLFKGDVITPAIKKALEEAKTYGALAIRSRTPVKSGKLKSGWEVHTSGNGIRYENDTPYAAYIEYGTRRISPRGMLTKSLPEIEDVFVKALSRELGKKMAAKITAAPSATPSYNNSNALQRDRLPEVKSSLRDRLVNRARKDLDILGL